SEDTSRWFHVYQASLATLDGDLCIQCTTDCKAILTTTLDLDDPKLVTRHNHAPGETKVVATKCRSRMKQQVKQSFDKPSQIIMSQISSEVDVSARVHIGRAESVKRTFRNQRFGRIPAELNSLFNI
ncbi:hypothetical protein LSH36_290g04032, partial [Paralvinella palmiformis]